MKYIVLGDTHGRTNWEKIVKNEEFDLVIFLGDYFDSRDKILPQQQLDNFINIMKYKKENMDKVVCLIGNHDFHYTLGTNDTYSGYQGLMRYDFGDKIEDAIRNNYIQICCVRDGYLFSHAGVTRTWCRYIFGEVPSINDLETKINALLHEQRNALEFTLGRNFSKYGDDICQPPTWVRPPSLKQDKIEGFIQIVGHTMCENIILGDDIVLIDTLGTSGEYLIIENGELKIGKGD